MKQLYGVGVTIQTAPASEKFGVIFYEKTSF